MFTLLLMATSLVFAQQETIAIDGETTIKAHRMCRLRATNVGKADGILWRVSPRNKIDKAINSPGLLQFVAPPGTYQIDLLVIRKEGESFRILEASTSVTFQGEEKEEEKPKPRKENIDALKALGQIAFGRSYCTAVVIGPQRDDGRWWVLTAAHCVSRLGQTGTFKTYDDKRFSIVVKTLSRTPDCAWCVTSDPIANLWWAKLAQKNPTAGVKVWHAGYGVHIPKNRETGFVKGGPNRNGQMEFMLSVSSGDSGGPIVREDNGEVVAVVCCTTRLSGYGLMFGCAPQVAWRLKPEEHAVNYGLKPTPMPLLSDPTIAVDLKPFPLRTP